MNYIYEMPFWRKGTRFHEKALGGWKFSGTDQFQSGPWLTPNISTATGARRPDRVGAPNYLDPRNVVTLTGGDGLPRADNFYFDPGPGGMFVAGKEGIRLHTVLERSSPPFDLDSRAPQTAGGTLQQAAATLLDHIYSAIRGNRAGLIELVRAAYADDQAAMDQFRLKAATTGPRYWRTPTTRHFRSLEWLRRHRVGGRGHCRSACHGISRMEHTCCRMAGRFHPRVGKLRLADFP